MSEVTASEGEGSAQFGVAVKESGGFKVEENFGDDMQEGTFCLQCGRLRQRTIFKLGVLDREV